MVELGLEPDNDTVYFDEGQFISVLKPSSKLMLVANTFFLFLLY